MAKEVNAYQLVSAIIRGIRLRLFFQAVVPTFLVTAICIVVGITLNALAWWPDIDTTNKSSTGFFIFLGLLMARGALGAALITLMIYLVSEGVSNMLDSCRHKVVSAPYKNVNKLRLISTLLPESAMRAIREAAKTRIITNGDVLSNLKAVEDQAVGSLRQQQQAALEIDPATSIPKAST